MFSFRWVRSTSCGRYMNWFRGKSDKIDGDNVQRRTLLSMPQTPVSHCSETSCLRSVASCFLAYFMSCTPRSAINFCSGICMLTWFVSVYSRRRMIQSCKVLPDSRRFPAASESSRVSSKDCLILKYCSAQYPAACYGVIFFEVSFAGSLVWNRGKTREMSEI